MNTITHKSFAGSLMLVLFTASMSAGQVPDHPIITEVYTDPPGMNDGPVGRDPTNLNQEFIEIYLPPAIALNPLLNADALRLAFYEVEGDSSSSGTGLVNYRFDLPTFDLNSANGLTPGALPRPPSGVVVLGWLDYVGDPPIALAGDVNSRVALVHGGITDTGGNYLFIAINGNHFGGTNNFPVVVAESMIDVPSETRSGVIQNGSSAYLLVERDSPGFVELCDDQHAVDCVAGADPALANEFAGLRASALLDGFAGNDDSMFDIVSQPYDAPTGDDIDLETVLPLGGEFSRLVAQIAESEAARPVPGVANGYSRRLVDVPKSTENASAVDDDPVADATFAYRHVRNAGPYFPTPGVAALTTSPPRLSVAAASEQVTQVLSQTTGRPGVLVANIGGDHRIDTTAEPSGGGDPLVATFAAGDTSLGLVGQAFGFPAIEVTVSDSATNGSQTQVDVAVTAVNTNNGDPMVLSPSGSTTTTVSILDPSFGLDAAGQPFEATVFVAAQALPEDVLIANEFAASHLGGYVTANLGGAVAETVGRSALLLNVDLDISVGSTIHTALQLVDTFPEIESDFLNFPGAVGTLNLVTTVLQSAEQAVSPGTYLGSINLTQTGIKAIVYDIPETRTYEGPYSTPDRVHFADAKGFVADPRSGLTNVTTPRTFELAILETNTRQDNTVESGATDDFGMIVRVSQTEPGAPVVPGQFVFLSVSGGFQGADIDTLEIPPNVNVATIVYLDLDNLHDHLGIVSIDQFIPIDGSGDGELDVMEVYVLNPFQCVTGDNDCDGDVDLVDYESFQSCVSGAGQPNTPSCGLYDFDGDQDVDLIDFGTFTILFTGSN
jgi:hypothetical protein